MAKVRFDKINKIFSGTEPVNRKWYEFWKISGAPCDVHVVKDISLEIKDGEFLVLVGPSGCGKSTTLRMLAGLEEVTSGSIYIDDKLMNDVSPKDRDIAMVFQNYALYPHMSVYDNMAFGLKLRKVPGDEIKKRVQQTSKLLGIEELLNRKPRELSGGQRQRVAMGRAIVREPKVFLMDEPLSNLDAKLRVQMRAELQKLHHRLGVTTVYVTHDQTEAMTLGHRIALLNNGIIQQLDTPLNLYEKPANMFVAGFIGSPSMNFINGKIEVDGGDVYVNTSSFKIKIFTDQLRNESGREVTIGIRPEHIFDREYSRKESYSWNTFEAVVEVTEPMGAEVILYLTIDQTSIIARVDAHTKARVGEKTNIVIDQDKVHIFDKETGENLIK
jgi:multiple sugar transport system ATP-binding protein